MATLDELIKDKQSVEQEIQALRQRDRESVIAEIHELMQLYDISPQQLWPASAFSSGKSSRRPSKLLNPSRYVDPATGQTWSGHGQRPKWLVAQLAQGRSLTELDTTQPVATKLASSALNKG